MHDFNTPQSYIEYAGSLSKAGKGTEAESALNRGLRIFKDNPALLNALGNQLAQHSAKRGAVISDEPALAALKKAHELAPNNTRFGVDYALQLGKRFESAKDAEARLLPWLDVRDPKNPDNPYVLAALAHHYHTAGHQKWARICYATCVATPPNDDISRRRIGGMDLQIYNPDVSKGFWYDFLDYRRAIIRRTYPVAIAKLLAPKVTREP